MRFIVLTLYGKQERVTNFSVTSFADREDALNFCSVINSLPVKDENEWIRAQLIREHKKYALKKPLLPNFTDLEKMSDRDLQRVFRYLDPTVLGIAIAEAGEDLKQKVFRNVSKRAADMLRENIEFRSPQNPADIQAAQQEIVTIIASMYSTGEIHRQEQTAAIMQSLT